MRTITAATLWIVRISGTLQLLLGVSFWTGHGYKYLPLHIVNGFVIVVTLWTAAALAFIARTRQGLAVFGILWGLVLPAFGIIQASVLPGSMHWVVRVAHLIMGLLAMGVAGTLGQAVLATLPPPRRQPERAGNVAVQSRAP